MLDHQRALKCQLVEKVWEGIITLEKAEYWSCAENEISLNLISKASLTTLLSAVDGLKHLARDTLLVRPDDAIQW